MTEDNFAFLLALKWKQTICVIAESNRRGKLDKASSEIRDLDCEYQIFKGQRVLSLKPGLYTGILLRDL